MTFRLFLSSFALVALVPGPLHAERRADHVFIISFDGGKPAVIHESEMPVLKKIAADGAVTWTAQTILPPKTLQSHTSMLTGVGPDKHHVDWNNYTPIKGKVKVPSIFALAKQRDPALVTAMFPGKQKFRHLWQPGSLDVFDYNGPQEDVPLPDTEEIEKLVIPAQTVAKNASAYIAAKKPNLCFIHFPDPDSAGHKSGWGSPEQKEAFKVSDQALGQIIKAIELGRHRLQHRRHHQRRPRRPFENPRREHSRRHEHPLDRLGQGREEKLHASPRRSRPTTPPPPRSGCSTCRCPPISTASR